MATWNVNGLRARLDFLLLWLRDRAPDVVGLQELKLTDEQFPHAEIEEAGYRAIVHGQKSWNGVAVLTRQELPAKLVQKGLPGQEEMGARLVTAEVAELAFTTVYVPNGKNLDHDDYPRKLAWLDALGDHLAQAHPPEQPHVLCGDFNVCAAPNDSWNEEKLAGDIFHTDAERACMARLTDAGHHDLFRTLHPDLQQFSWWDYRGGAFHRGHGLRIDLLLATPPVRERVREAGTDRDYRKKQDGLTASDHAPVIVDLERAD